MIVRVFTCLRPFVWAGWTHIIGKTERGFNLASVAPLNFPRRRLPPAPLLPTASGLSARSVFPRPKEKRYKKCPAKMPPTGDVSVKLCGSRDRIIRLDLSAARMRRSCGGGTCLNAIDRASSDDVLLWEAEDCAGMLRIRFQGGV